MDSRERSTLKADQGLSSGRGSVCPVSTPMAVVRSGHPEKVVATVLDHLDISGWVSIPRRRCAGSAPVQSRSFEEGAGVVVASQVDQERVSLNTPNGKCSVRLNCRKVKSGHSKEKGRSGDKQGEELRTSQKALEGEVSEWLSEKVIERGRAVGVSVEPNVDRWGNLVKFAKAREEEIHQDSVVGKSKKRGGRETHNLRCIVNCENGKECELEGQKVRRSGRRKKGEISSSN